MDIGRVVPGVRQRFVDRHAAAQGELCADAPVSKVRECHDSGRCDPQHFREHAVGPTHGLQCFRHDDDVEATCLEGGQVIIQILFEHIHAALYTRAYVLWIDLESIAVHALVCGEPREEGPRAAAEIEDASAGFDHFCYQREIRALVEVYGRHASISCAMRAM